LDKKENYFKTWYGRSLDMVASRILEIKCANKGINWQSIMCTFKIIIEKQILAQFHMNMMLHDHGTLFQYRIRDKMAHYFNTQWTPVCTEVAVLSCM
jgi:hypothetical protein